MPTDLIRYDLLVQDALRGVVRTALSDAARSGLQGDHHFFITFKTTAQGLRLSDRMRERYPDKMTIILQHQFWDLAVTEHGFEVGLSFSNKPERLLVPFAAITAFEDPSVQFSLKFDLLDPAAVDEAGEPDAGPAEPVKALPAKRGLAAVETSAATGATEAARIAKADAKPKPALAKVVTEAAKERDGKGRDDKGKADGEPTKVVSIDAFRKKP